MDALIKEGYEVLSYGDGPREITGISPKFYSPLASYSEYLIKIKIALVYEFNTALLRVIINYLEIRFGVFTVANKTIADVLNDFSEIHNILKSNMDIRKIFMEEYLPFLVKKMKKVYQLLKAPFNCNLFLNDLTEKQLYYNRTVNLFGMNEYEKENYFFSNAIIYLFSAAIKYQLTSHEDANKILTSKSKRSFHNILNYLIDFINAHTFSYPKFYFITHDKALLFYMFKNPGFINEENLNFIRLFVDEEKVLSETNGIIKNLPNLYNIAC